MTKEEAIKRLEWIRGSSFCRYSSQSVSDSLDMAIDALRYGGPKYVLLSTPSADAQTIDTGIDALREQYVRDVTKTSGETVTNRNGLNGWISVEERLPEEAIRVLVRLDGNTPPIGEPRMDTDRVVDGRWVRWFDLVTHWMPLPEAPKEEV